MAGDVDALWDHVVADPAVRCHADPAPDPGPPKGPALLAWRDGDVIRVRHWAGTADAASPVMVVRTRPDRGALAVDARLEQPSASRTFGAPPTRPNLVLGVALPIVLLGAIVALAYAVAGSALLWALPALLLLFAIPSSLVMLPALALWNAESRRVQRETLITWLGRTFMPLALAADPEGEEPGPFR